MAHFGTLKDALVAEAGEDVRGSRLYGLNDEKLGKIDDVIFDHSSGEFHYVVVDTGGWLDRKKFRTCSGESAGKRVCESADTLRKAG
jgi:uncharacterized protein YrrD